MATFTRDPIIALDYSEKQKAMLKEIMVDYATGNIYVVSATDKSVIFDVTHKILDQITDLNASNIEVTIEGVGVVNLTEFLNQLNVDMKKSFHIKDPGEVPSYIIKDTSLDNASLKVFNGKIEVDSYTAADMLTLPQKTANGIRWMPIGNLLAGMTFNGVSYSEIDGNLTRVPIVVNDNNKIYLSSNAQRSYNLQGNFTNVYLPSTLDEYSIIKWQVIQMETDFNIILDSNVLISNTIGMAIINNNPESTILIPKCTDSTKTIYKFTFETFDAGLTWILDIAKYNKIGGVI